MAVTIGFGTSESARRLICREYAIFAFARLALLCFLLTTLSASAETSPVQVSAESQSIDLSSATWLLEDQNGRLKLADVQSPAIASRFKPGSPGIGFTASAYWLRFTLSNEALTPATWWLDSGDRFMQEMDVFSPDAHGLYQHQSASSTRPFADRPVRTTKFVFPILLQVGKPVEIFMRVRSTGYMPIALSPELWQPDAHQIAASTLNSKWMFYLGMAAALALFNLLLFFFIRDRNYLFYVMAQVAMVWWLSISRFGSGLAYEYIWPDSPIFNQISLVLSSIVALYCVYLFQSRLLDLPRIRPKLDRLWERTILVQFLASAPTMLGPVLPSVMSVQLVQDAFRLMYLVAAFAFTWNWYAVNTLFRSGNRAAKALTIAWSPAFLIMLYVMPLSYLSIRINWAIPPMMLGSGLEMILMSLALADRVNEAKEGKAKAQAELVEGLRQSERELESKIEQRTAEVKVQAAQLAEWNHTLEQRVQEQVNQIDRLDHLKRFFSPQLAEAIAAKGKEALRTHRREISVVFIDLRGFSAFTDRAEPEEVIDMLHGFHGLMGRIVMEYSGTLERFAGDSIMIFFNDPVLIANHAEKAVRMALAMQETFRQLSAEWRQRGYKLGLGCGIALGYATLGEIGFEGRWDYAAIGSVTNLAARLCAEAGAGEVFVDRKVMSEVEALVHATSVGPLLLKGFAQPVPAFLLTGLNSTT